MAKVTAKVTAKGKRAGKLVVIECIEYCGSDDNRRHVVVLKDGKEDDYTTLLFDGYVSQSYARRAKRECCYNPARNSIEAYWLIMHEVYFDAVPEITVEGKIFTFGSPYSNEDTSGVVF